MRLGRNGEIIAETGFDGGSYSPRYASRTSVYLGDMSREDIRIKKEVDARNRAIAKQNAVAAETNAAAAKQKYLIQSKMKEQIAIREARSNRMMELAKARGYEAAVASGKSPDINPWVGSPHAGFGAEGEVRIDPDSNVDVKIADSNIPAVAEYGVNNWMEDPSQIQTYVEQAATGQTRGKVVLQTMVDYAKYPDLSVVGLPLASQVSTELATAQAAIASETKTDSNVVRYGLYALAAWLLLK